MNFVFEQYFMYVVCRHLSKLRAINIKQWKKHEQYINITILRFASNKHQAF